jgi:hypothetical protein
MRGRMSCTAGDRGRAPRGRRRARARRTRRRPLELLERAVVVEVLGVDVGDDRDGGREAQEAAVALVGLGHEEIALAEARVEPSAPSCRRRPRWGRGPRPQSTVATSEVVVVLPCEPAMATPYFTRISSASISARGMTGMPRARASTSSGLSGRIALEKTTTSTPRDVLARWPTSMRAPRARRGGGWSSSPSCRCPTPRTRASGGSRRGRSCRCRRCRRSECAERVRETYATSRASEALGARSASSGESSALSGRGGVPPDDLETLARARRAS